MSGTKLFAIRRPCVMRTLSVKVTKCVYPNVRINLNSFTTTTSTEYGKCNIVCGPNDIEFR